MNSGFILFSSIIIMSSSQNPEAFYQKLKEQLKADTHWPNLYLYKFILPASSTQEKELVAIFDKLGAVITTNISKTGKYKSFSIKVRLQNPDAVISKYKEVGDKITDVISL